MPKSEFYDMYGSGFDSLCIGSERDPTKHAQMKKSLSAAFSTKALGQQESIVQRCVNGFVQRLGVDGACEKGLNMTKWFEMIAFDILGEMAFGESFHCVQNGKRDRKGDLATKRLGQTLISNFSRKAALLVRDDRRAPLFCDSLGQPAALSAYCSARAQTFASIDGFCARSPFRLQPREGGEVYGLVGCTF